MSDTLAPVKFDLDSYLIDRQLRDDFVLVEIGHDAQPIAYEQVTPFTGGRVYIGVESWQRDPDGAIKQPYLSQLHQASANQQNIFYTQINPGGEVVRESRESPLRYIGDYDPRSILPAGIADEVYLSNVFCDPHVAYHVRRTDALLTEIARLATDDGVLVIRETITPQLVRYMNDHLLAANGLVELARVKAGESEWDKLEATYPPAVAKFCPAPGSYYQLLSKTADDHRSQ